MKKGKRVLISISVFLMTLITIVSYRLLTHSNKDTYNNKMAIYVKNNGTYTLASFNQIPKKGYTLNTTLSVCDDANTTINWDNTTRTISLTTSTNPKCTIYLDTIPTYTLTINKNSTYIDSVTPVSGGVYEAGEVIDISATLKTNSKFTSWSQTSGTTGSFGSTTSASTTFTMPASNATIYANGETDTIYASTVDYTSPTGENNVQDAIDDLFEIIEELEGEL